MVISGCGQHVLITPFIRVILAAQSDYFKSLLFGSMKEAEPNSVINLEDISMATLQLLIRFAYCGRVQLKNASLQVIT